MSTGNITRNEAWAIVALGRELDNLTGMEKHNVNKAGSPYSVTLLRIASICNGAGKGYLPTGLVFQSITQASWKLEVKENVAMRTWIRALRVAQPRYPA